MDRTIENPSLPRSERTQWDRIAASERFENLLANRKRFVIPAFAFFFGYYFLLPVLVGYAPGLMSTRVMGTVNLAYLLALSQFVVGWIIAWRYLKASAKLDLLRRDVLAKGDNPRGER